MDVDSVFDINNIRCIICIIAITDIEFIDSICIIDMSDCMHVESICNCKIVMFDIDIGGTYNVGGGLVDIGTVNGALNVPVKYAGL
jgi:hypothetical protein